MVGCVLPVSILDLAPIVVGGTPAQALRNSLDLAQHAERLGYSRYWVAEHHNLSGIASAATSVVIAHLAQGTQTIRVGAGGVMLPNHPPLVIAEQFGTLEALFPGQDRSRPGACARHRPGDAAGAPAGSECRLVPSRRSRAAGVARRSAAGPDGVCDPGRGIARSALDPRLEPLRRAARGGAGAPVRVRIALRARRAAPRAGCLPGPLPAVGAAASSRTRWSL